MNRSLNESTSYEDRWGGLSTFGIVEVLIGVLIGISIPSFFQEQLMRVQKTGIMVNFEDRLFAAVWYSIWALILVGLGIGSIKARRWARVLALILAWWNLVLGLLATIATIPSLPNLAAMARKEEMVIMPYITFGILFLILVGLPLIGVLFYGNKHVKVTCEANSPVSWTDACPLPVLTAVVYAIIVDTFLLLTFISHAVFASKITTPNEIIWFVVLFFIALEAFSAWKMYRLRVSGWCIQMVIIALVVILILISMIYPGWSWINQAASMAKNLLLSLSGFVLLPCMLWLGYLLWIKRFFKRKGAEKYPALPTQPAS